MSIKSFFKDLLQPRITTVIEADYKNLPPEMLEQLINDSIAITVEILQEKLPTPERLELLADWFDKTTSDNPDKEVQKDLRKWAEGIRSIQKLYDGAKRKTNYPAKQYKICLSRIAGAYVRLKSGRKPSDSVGRHHIEFKC